LSQPQDSISDTYSHPKSYTPKHLAKKILTTRSALEGERKIVTVFFADVANYTSMSERLDPESVHKIMDGCFKILLNQIHNYEGTINQFTGDGVMALFGAPIAHEDHAQKACYAALSIQESLKEYRKLLNDNFGVSFSMRIGINSGPVVVGSIGDDLRMDYTAIGDTTNLAARMESLAQPGTILVSKNTYQKVKPHFDFELLGKYEVKGKKEQQDAYQLKNKRDRSHLGFTRQIYSAIVGRDAELNKLELQVLKTVDGKGAIVNVIGEAGIGKSRLIAELKQSDLIKRISLREGRAISMGKGLSFYPIIDIYKNWAQIKEGDSDAVTVDKLEASIRSVSPLETDEILPFIATLMGIKLTGRYADRVKEIEGEALEKLILKSVKDLLISSSKKIPLAIVIEDLHWADLSTIELLESMFRLAETHRILFINVFRPRYTGTGMRIIQTVKEKFPDHYVQIELQPLNEQMSETLINNMLNISGLPHGVKDMIVKRAGGNPFFIEEVVRSFIDDGVILRKDEGFEVTPKIESVVIPQTINEVLIARIDRLEEKSKDLVKTASVIGRSFFYKILTEVLKNFEDIDTKLDYLKEIQLIRDRVRMEELEYLFKHALTREAVYESLLVQKRQELHNKVASSIESVFEEKIHEFFGMLAYHYSKAENLEKTEEYMVKAGEEALRSSASSEALNYFKEALKLYLNKHGDGADPNQLALFEKNIALALFSKGKDADAIEYFDKALVRWGVKPSKKLIPQVFTLLMDIFVLILKVYIPILNTNKKHSELDNEVFDLCYKKAESLVQVNPWRNFTEQMSTIRRSFKYDLHKLYNGAVFPLSCCGLFTYTGISQGLAKKFLGYAKKFVDFENYKEKMEYVYYHNLYSSMSGNWELMKDYNEDLIERNLKIGEFWHISTYYLCLAEVKMEQGFFNEAENLLNKLNEVYDSYEYHGAKVWQFYTLANLRIFSRNLYEAIKICDEGVVFSEKIGMDPFKIHLLSVKSNAQIILKDLDGAKISLEKAEEIFNQQQIVPPLYAICYLVSLFTLNLALLEKAMVLNDQFKSRKHKKFIKKSIKKLTKTAHSYGFWRLEAYRVIGLYHWVVNDQSRAMKAWAKSIKEAERMDSKLYLARIYKDIGSKIFEEKSHYKQLNGMTSQKYLENAREMFHEMDLKWDLDELDKITSDN
jgi:class 3 adenylate cyclase/tetratricopeptide (TPR) repeat protein